jgi:cleavage and polyadenylation specificity factor subunit 3
MAHKRKAADMAGHAEVDDDPVSPDDEFFFQGLGGCQEVGRSCHIIRYKGKTIMVREVSMGV